MEQCCLRIESRHSRIARRPILEPGISNIDSFPAYHVDVHEGENISGGWNTHRPFVLHAHSCRDNGKPGWPYRLPHWWVSWGILTTDVRRANDQNEDRSFRSQGWPFHAPKSNAHSDFTYKTKRKQKEYRRWVCKRPRRTVLYQCSLRSSVRKWCSPRAAPSSRWADMAGLQWGILARRHPAGV